MADLYVWETARFGPGVRRVAATRLTSQSVWIRGLGGKERRSPRISEWFQYHESYQEARDFLLRRYRQEVATAEDRLTTARLNLAKVEALPDVMNLPETEVSDG